MDLRARLGQNIKEWRTRQGLSQEQLAFDAEIDRTYVSDMERGKRNPTVLVLARIARVLNVRLVDLLDGVE